MKCLEKDRTRRYETANGLAADLKRHLNNEPVVARPPSAAYRFQKAFRRNKLAFTAGVAVAVALLLGILVSTWQSVRATHAKQEALAAQTREANQREQAQASEKKALAAQANETTLRQRAEAEELAARQKAYASDMNLAQQALAANNLGRARELLNRQVPQTGQTDLRGWEWRYLWQYCRSDAESVLCQQKGNIWSLSTSADGKWLAVGEAPGGAGVSVWDLAKRKDIAHLDASENDTRVAFSPRESVLAYSVETAQGASSGRPKVRLWDGLTQQILREVPIDGSCMGLAFSDDNQKLITAAASPANQVAIWDVATGTKLASHPVSPFDLAVTTGTPLAATGDLGIVAVGPQDTIEVFDSATGKQRWAKKAADEAVKSLAFSPDGKVLASGAGFVESAIRLWDVATGAEIGRLEGHRAWITQLVFWPDGKTLASASGDETIRLWDVTDPARGRPLSVLRGHNLEVWRLALLPDHTTLVSGSKDGSVLVWDTGAIQRRRNHVTLPANVAAWRFGPDSKSLLAVDLSGRVARWSGADFQEAQPLLEIGTNFVQACLSEDGRWMSCGSTDGQIRVWDLQSNTSLRAINTRARTVLPCFFIGQGKELVVLHVDDNSIHQWDLRTQQKTRSWRGTPRVGAHSLSGSSDGRWGFAANYSTSSLVDLTTGHETTVNLPDADSAAFSLDGKLLAAAASHGHILLWNTATQRTVAKLRGFLMGIHSVAFSPDGKRLAAGSDGQEAIKLWDVENAQDPQELLTLEGEGSFFWSSAFSPDGNVLGALNRKGLLHLWRAPSWDQIAAAVANEKTETQPR